MIKIGKKIKNMRLTQELTQEELANRANLTKGFISLVERDLQSPALDTLDSILNALNSSLAQFFGENETRSVVFPPENRAHIKNENGMVKEILIPAAQGREVDMMILSLPPGSATQVESPHYGDECGLVLSGNIWIHLGQDVFRAASGDAFYYTACEAHWLENRSQAMSRVIWVSSPPSF